MNRLGFALQLGALRYLGFCPKDVANVTFVAEQRLCEVSTTPGAPCQQ